MKGYQPKVAYTKLTHGPSGESIVFYFDSRGREIGRGRLMDDVFFKYIPNEQWRRSKEQVVDLAKYKSMVQDDAPFYIRPNVKAHGSSR